MIDNSKEYILCAAVKRLDGTFDIGYRHSDIYSKVPREKIEDTYGIDFFNDMGFFTSKERFVGRREAYKIAVECGQIKPRVFREDGAIDKWLGVKYTKEDFEWLESEDLY